ncbi:MAG: thioredoxin family protein [Fusobacteriaceae bacterium]
MNFKDFFQVGMNFETFVGTGSKSERDRIPKNYNRIIMDENTLQRIGKLKKLNFLIAGEIWCPDVQLNSSVVKKICDNNPLLDLRMITKGRGEKYLKPLLQIENFKIPVILILDEEYNLISTFLERPEKVKEIENFEEIKLEYLKGKYLSETLEEILTLCEKR